MTMWVPTFAVSALKGLSGSKVKEISFRPTFKESALTEVPITGSTKAVALATQLIKMAVLYAQAGDKPPPPGVPQGQEGGDSLLTPSLGSDRYTRKGTIQTNLVENSENIYFSD